MDHGDAVAGEALHDEALAAEEADADLLLEGDADLHALGGAEEGVLLADQFTAELVEVHRDDLARVGRGEGDDLAAGGPAAVKVVMNSDSPVRRALAGGHDLAEEAPGFAADGSPKTVCIWMPGGHVHHAAGLGDDGLAGVEGDLDVLHLGAEDLVVDLVGAAGASRTGPSRTARAAAGGDGRRPGGRHGAAGVGGGHARADGVDLPRRGPGAEAGAVDQGAPPPCCGRRRTSSSRFMGPMDWPLSATCQPSLSAIVLSPWKVASRIERRRGPRRAAGAAINKPARIDLSANRRR